MNAPASHPADALLSLAYGELPAEEARSVQAHLDGCAECAATLSGYRAVREAVRALPRELPAAARVEPLLLAAQAATDKARRRRRTQWTGSLLAGAAAAALALFALRPSRAPESTAAVASAPAAVPVPPGALALNTVPRPEDRPARREVDDVARPAGVPAKTARAKAAPAEALARRDVVVAAPAQALEAKKAQSPLPQAAAGAAPNLSLPAAARVGAAGASVPSTAGAAVGASADTAAPLPAAAQRTQDEAQRKALLLRLKEASPGEALPLLWQLCTLEERLGHAGEARAACTKVVEGYPGTPEATAARAALQRLGPAPSPP